MSTPAETQPATPATEPEVANDAKDATLTVDVAAAADKGDTKQRPESPEVVTPGGTILAKVPEPETGLCSIGVSAKRKSPTPDEDKKAEDNEAGDKEGDDAPEEEASPARGKRARAAAEALEEALKSDGDKKAAAEEEAPKAEEKPPDAMPPAVVRQMTTLSPTSVAPPSLQREATVAA